MSYTRMAEGLPCCVNRTNTSSHRCPRPAAHIRHSLDAFVLAGALGEWEADSTASFHARELLQAGSASLLLLSAHYRLC